ncbi:MAG: NDP-sugar synthase [Lachnospiraceae bacterium]
MKKTTLVIMAAGIGSRFGGGIKQLAPVGPSGEIIMDYSIHDALEAGFNKVVFIIRKDLEKDFREIIGNRIAEIPEVAYAFQEVDNLPEGFAVPEGRTKPWGTGQAVLACKDVVDTPFLVINADDYYGKEAYVKIHEYLVQDRQAGELFDICMAGFILGNTLSDNGSVTRGVCRIDESGSLVGVDETSDIVKAEGGKAAIDAADGLQPIDVNSLVSMNMWGLTPDFLEVLEAGFVDFLKGVEPGNIKKEYLLPSIIDQLIKEKKAKVTVLKTDDEWFGVTYSEDKASVEQAFKNLIEKGVYSEKLFN